MKSSFRECLSLAQQASITNDFSYLACGNSLQVFKSDDTPHATWDVKNTGDNYSLITSLVVGSTWLHKETVVISVQDVSGIHCAIVMLLDGECKVLHRTETKPYGLDLFRDNLYVLFDGIVETFNIISQQASSSVELISMKQSRTNIVCGTQPLIKFGVLDENECVVLVCGQPSAGDDQNIVYRVNHNTGEIVSKWGSQLATMLPSDMDISREKAVLVIADMKSNKLDVFTVFGEHEWAVHEAGDDCQLVQPFLCKFDPDGNIFAAWNRKKPNHAFLAWGNDESTEDDSDYEVSDASETSDLENPNAEITSPEEENETLSKRKDNFEATLESQVLECQRNLNEQHINTKKVEQISRVARIPKPISAYKERNISPQEAFATVTSSINGKHVIPTPRDTHGKFGIQVVLNKLTLNPQHSISGRVHVMYVVLQSSIRGIGQHSPTHTQRVSCSPDLRCIMQCDTRAKKNPVGIHSITLPVLFLQYFRNPRFQASIELWTSSSTGHKSLGHVDITNTVRELVVQAAVNRTMTTQLELSNAKHSQVAQLAVEFEYRECDHIESKQQGDPILQPSKPHTVIEDMYSRYDDDEYYSIGQLPTAVNDLVRELVSALCKHQGYRRVLSLVRLAESSKHICNAICHLMGPEGVRIATQMLSSSTYKTRIASAKLIQVLLGNDIKGSYNQLLFMKQTDTLGCVVEISRTSLPGFGINFHSTLSDAGSKHSECTTNKSDGDNEDEFEEEKFKYFVIHIPLATRELYKTWLQSSNSKTQERVPSEAGLVKYIQDVLVPSCLVHAGETNDSHDGSIPKIVFIQPSQLGNKWSTRDNKYQQKDPRVHLIAFKLQKTTRVWNIAQRDEFCASESGIASILATRDRQRLQALQHRFRLLMEEYSKHQIERFGKETQGSAYLPRRWVCQDPHVQSLVQNGSQLDGYFALLGCEKLCYEHLRSFHLYQSFLAQSKTSLLRNNDPSTQDALFNEGPILLHECNLDYHGTPLQVIAHVVPLQGFPNRAALEIQATHIETGLKFSKTLDNSDFKIHESNNKISGHNDDENHIYETRSALLALETSSLAKLCSSIQLSDKCIAALQGSLQEIVSVEQECSNNTEFLVESIEPATVKFSNSTGLSVDVYWIDLLGNELYFFTLEPETSQRQQSWISHSWTARPSDALPDGSRERLWMGNARNVVSLGPNGTCPGNWDTEERMQLVDIQQWPGRYCCPINKMIGSATSESALHRRALIANYLATFAPDHIQKLSYFDSKFECNSNGDLELVKELYSRYGKAIHVVKTENAGYKISYYEQTTCTESICGSVSVSFNSVSIPHQQQNVACKDLFLRVAVLPQVKGENYVLSEYGTPLPSPNSDTSTNTTWIWDDDNSIQNLQVAQVQLPLEPVLHIEIWVDQSIVLNCASNEDSIASNSSNKESIKCCDEVATEQQSQTLTSSTGPHVVADVFYPLRSLLGPQRSKFKPESISRQNVRAALSTIGQQSSDGYVDMILEYSSTTKMNELKQGNNDPHRGHIVLNPVNEIPKQDVPVTCNGNQVQVINASFVLQCALQQGAKLWNRGQRQECFELLLEACTKAISKMTFNEREKRSCMIRAVRKAKLRLYHQSHNGNTNSVSKASLNTPARCSEAAAILLWIACERFLGIPKQHRTVPISVCGSKSTKANRESALLVQANQTSAKHHEDAVWQKSQQQIQTQKRANDKHAKAVRRSRAKLVAKREKEARKKEKMLSDNRAREFQDFAKWYREEYRLQKVELKQKEVAQREKQTRLAAKKKENQIALERQREQIEVRRKWLEDVAIAKAERAAEARKRIVASRTKNLNAILSEGSSIQLDEPVPIPSLLKKQPTVQIAANENVSSIHSAQRTNQVDTFDSVPWEEVLDWPELPAKPTKPRNSSKLRKLIKEARRNGTKVNPETVLSSPYF